MRRSTAEMRIEQADHARDSKKEQVMCAYGSCMSSHGLREAPKGYRGPYGGSKLCESCYEKVADYLAKHGHLPSEDHEQGWCDE